LLLEQLNYNLLFRWFVGLSPDDPIWHPTTFTKNRERLLNEQIMERFLEKLMAAPEAGLIQSLSQGPLPGLSAWVEVGGVAPSLCSTAPPLQPIST
jgi:hypothetical protein